MRIATRDLIQTGSAVPPSRHKPKRRRPLQVTILAALHAISFATMAAAIAWIAVDPHANLVEIGARDLSGLTDAEATRLALLVSVPLGLYGAIQLTVAVALFKLRRIGWTLAMLMAGVGLVTQISNWWTSGALLEIPMLTNVVTVLYLNQRPVRLTFGLGGPPDTIDPVGDRG